MPRSHTIGENSSHAQSGNVGLGLRVPGCSQFSDLTNVNIFSRSHETQPVSSFTGPGDENQCPQVAPEGQPCATSKSNAQRAYNQEGESHAAVFLGHSVASGMSQNASHHVPSSTQGLQRQEYDPASHLPSKQEEGGRQISTFEQLSSTNSIVPTNPDSYNDDSVRANQSLGPPSSKRVLTRNRGQVNLYPTSPTARQRALPIKSSPAVLTPETVSCKRMLGHRSSHSLGQIASISTPFVGNFLTDSSFLSVPGSPTERMSPRALASYFQFPAQKPSLTHAITDQRGYFGGSAGQDYCTRPSSVHSVSPSHSLASASLSSTSPLAGTLINADGSFTSQDASFDSLSNTASEPLSRASSSSEEPFYHGLNLLGLPTSVRLSKQKVRLRNIDRKLICDYSHANPTAKQDTIASRFGIERSTVSKILKQKDKWRAIDPQSDQARISKHRAVKFPVIEDRLTNWVARLRSEGALIKDAMIRKEALCIAQELGLREDKFKASGGWIEKFRERQGLQKPTSVEHTLHKADPPTSIRFSTLRSERWMLNCMTSREDPLPSPTHDDLASCAEPMPSAEPPPQKRARFGLKLVPSRSITSSLCKDLDPMQLFGQNSGDIGSTGFQALVSAGQTSIDDLENLDSCQSVTNIELGSATAAVAQRDTEAAAFYAMNKDLGSTALKRNCTKPQGHTLSKYKVDCLLGPKSIETQSDALFSVEQCLDRHEGSKTCTNQTGTNFSACNSASAEGCGRIGCEVAQSATKRHQPKFPSPLRLTAVEELSNQQSTIDTGLREQLPAVLQDRLEKIKNDASMTVSPGQAQQSLDLVLKFLSEQPSTFLPSNHFLVIGHLQANIDQLARGNSPSNIDGEGINPCPDSGPKPPEQGDVV